MGQSHQDIEHPFISIILPVYNAQSIHPTYLTEALESIASQTYADFELIIVNDGSTDDSARICFDFINQHPDIPIHYHNKKNGGQSSARNYGARLSHGDYLCFMDQDDRGYENMLEVRVAYLDADTDLLYTDADIISFDGTISLQGIHQNHRYGSPHPKKSLEDILYKDIVVMTGLMMIKRDTFFQVKGFDENLSGYEDDDLFLRIYAIGKIKYIPISTLQWRDYDSSCSRSERMIISRNHFYHKLINGYTDGGKDLKRVRNISWRFFRLFLVQAMLYQEKNSSLFEANMAGVRETLESLPWLFKLSFGLPLLLGGNSGVKLIRWIYLKKRRREISSGPGNKSLFMKPIESTKSPLVSVIIVNWNGRKVLYRCLTSVLAQSYKDFEVIVVDNGSTDGSVDGLEGSWPGIRVIRLKENRGFAAANNLGARLAQGTWIALLNNDAFPTTGWLDSLVSAAINNPDFTFFASCLTMAQQNEYLDGMGDVYHESGMAWRRGHRTQLKDHESKPSEVFGPCAAAALYPRKIFLQVGGFDEAFFCYHEDVDLAFRLRLLGHRCLYLPEAMVEHIGSGSQGAHSDFVIYYGHRNLVWTYFKNMPAVLFWRYLPSHLILNIISLLWFSLKGHGRSIWRAKGDAVKGLSSVLKKRRQIQKDRQIAISEIQRIIDHGWLKPYKEVGKRLD